ncbi:copper amine oxidase N-terminal domain-containing protein [Paenibacillus humicus]|uniref:copper amine oxidase N-terminal domain-containing protein n=1 Tax=Paenibacillus humicus TaxID=412861 RepID=UPI000FD9F5F3|nr:copper amine oxidase N-terminal domain-containing protein [Paenibacillus humicus]
MKRTGRKAAAYAAAAALLVMGTGAGSAAAAAAKPAAAAAQAAAAAAQAVVKAESIGAKLVVDGKLQKLKEGNYILMAGGRVYVPLRVAAAALECRVEWDSKSRSVSLWTPTARQQQAAEGKAGTVYTVPSAPAGHKLSLTDAKASFYADGKAAVLPKDQRAYIAAGTIYVPLRFLAELSGAAVQWTSSSQLIELSLPAAGGAGGSSEGGLSGPGEGSSGASPDNPGSAAGSPESPPASGGSPGGVPAPAVPGTGAPGTPSVPDPGPSVPTPTPTVPPGTGNPPVTAPPAPTPAPQPSLPQKDIQNAAEDKLNSLLVQCQNRLMDAAFRYMQSGSAEAKSKIRAEGEAALADCDRSFETILTDTKTKLEAGGYSTAILATYRNMYEEQKAIGVKMLDNMMQKP